MAFLMFVFALPYYFIFSSLALPFASVVVIPILLAYGGSVLCNGFYLYGWAPFIQIATQSIVLPFYSIYLGLGSGAHLLIMPLAILPFVFFSKSQHHRFRFMGFLCVTLGLFVLACGHLFLPTLTLTLPHPTLQFLSICAYITTFGLILLQISAFYLTEQAMQKELIESKTMQRKLKQHANYTHLIRRIAYEFKNPLQLLQSTVELGQANQSSAHDVYSIALDSIQRLDRLIDPILFYFNDPKPYFFSNFNICTVIDQIMQLSHAQCKRYRILITTQNHSSDPTVFADEKIIGQVLINLISNAIDALKQSAERSIQITVRDQLNNQSTPPTPGVYVTVTDTGCGINKDELERIFIPFETNQPHRNNVGLGLSIVSKYIYDHDGLLDVQSTKNEGSTFGFWLKKPTH